VLLAALVVALSQSASSPASGPLTVLLQFPATDDRPAYSVPLSRDVVLNIRRAVDARGHHMGWDLAANDRRLERDTNFFYECLCGHGPRPHELYAWHFATSYYPTERDLPVYGYPLEVRIRCLECEFEGKDGTDARFIRGTIEVSVRRMGTAYPRQRTLRDVVQSGPR
jgi:hypothetical protein